MATHDFVAFSNRDGDGERESDLAIWRMKTFYGVTFAFSDTIDLVHQLVTRCKGGGDRIGNLNIYAHGGTDHANALGVFLGDDFTGNIGMPNYCKWLAKLKPLFATGALVTFDVCAFGHARGALQMLSKAMGVPVKAYRDLQSPDFFGPQGEGPFVICTATGCTQSDAASWNRADGRNIIGG